MKKAIGYITTAWYREGAVLIGEYIPIEKEEFAEKITKYFKAPHSPKYALRAALKTIEESNYDPCMRFDIQLIGN